MRFEGKTYTYQELNENANRVANGLSNLGIGRGDRVALMMPNIPEFAFSFFGIQKIGSVAVPFNTMYKGREISFILKDAGARAIICLANFANLINEIKGECPDLDYVIVTGQRTLVFIDPDATVNVQMVFEKTKFESGDHAFHAIGETLTEVFKELGVADAWYKHQGAVRAHGKKLATILLSEIENLFIINIVAFLTAMDTDALFKVIWVPLEIKDKALEPMTSIGEESGDTPTFERFSQLVVGALSKKLGVDIEEGKLSRDELMAYEKNRALAGRI
ncbi:MAG: acyl-CoA synthetase [Spirochaetales bacterium]|nr:acyl-CoA synthetase [Spirochaetales bacterium]